MCVSICISINILHYCVSNMPGAVPHTSTIALTNITLPYISTISKSGLKLAVNEDNSLLLGLNMYNGNITHNGVANTFNLNYKDPTTIL